MPLFLPLALGCPEWSQRERFVFCLIFLEGRGGLRLGIPRAVGDDPARDDDDDDDDDEKRKTQLSARAVPGRSRPFQAVPGRFLFRRPHWNNATSSGRLRSGHYRNSRWPEKPANHFPFCCCFFFSFEKKTRSDAAFRRRLLPPRVSQWSGVTTPVGGRRLRSRGSREVFVQ